MTTTTATLDLSPAARAALAALATVQTAGIGATATEIADLADLTVDAFDDAVDELVNAGMIARPAPAERLSMPARAVLLRLATACDAVPRGELDDALGAVGVDAAQTITGLADAGLIAIDDDGAYITDAGMTLIEADARAGIVDTDPIQVRLATARLRALCATADHHGHTLTEAVLAVEQ